MQDPFTISYDLRKVGTFQLSDIFYNTVGGAVGGLMYYAAMKIRRTFSDRHWGQAPGIKNKQILKSL